MTSVTQAVSRPGADIWVDDLDDSVLIHLRGHLDHTCLGELRDALLRPRPHGRQAVVLDAGYVETATPAVLAILLSAGDWISNTGGRMVFATLSWALLDLVRAYGVAGDLPRLPAADSPSRLGSPALVRLP